MKRQIKFSGDFFAATKTAPCQHTVRAGTGRSKYQPGTVGAKQAAKLAKKQTP